MREYWGEHIYRTIVETRDFSVPSEENVGEIHKQIAAYRRQAMQREQKDVLTSPLDSFKIIEMGGHQGALSEKQMKIAINVTNPKDIEFNIESQKLMIKAM